MGTCPTALLLTQMGILLLLEVPKAGQEHSTAYAKTAVWKVFCLVVKAENESWNCGMQAPGKGQDFPA